MQSSVAVGEEMVDIKDVHPTRADATTHPVAVMIAQARPMSAAAGAQAVQTIGVCTVADTSGNSGPPGMVPGGAVESYQRNVEKLSDWMVPPKNESVTVLENPLHGVLSETSANGQTGGYLYTATSGYTGEDKATFLVDTGTRRFKVVYFIKVYKDTGDTEVECEKTLWRISSLISTPPQH